MPVDIHPGGYNGGVTGKRISSFFAFSAASLAILSASSYLTTVSFALMETDHNAVVLHFYDGRSRMFWFHSPEDPIETKRDVWSGVIHVRSKIRRAQHLPDHEYGTPSPPSFSVPIRVARRGQIAAFGGQWRAEISNRAWPPVDAHSSTWSFESSLIRVPTWPMVLLLMIPPIYRSILERRRQRRAARNECLACGYDLTALVEPRCPECGTPTSIPTQA